MPDSGKVNLGLDLVFKRTTALAPEKKEGITQFMKMKAYKKTVCYLGLLGILICGPLAVSASAAACSPETGEWRHFKKTLTPEEQSALVGNSFKPAKVFSGPRGVIHAQPGSVLEGVYSVRASWAGGRLRLQFIQAKKAVGELELELPQEWSFFQTQAPEVRDYSSDEKRMYKELRAEGKFNAAGIFTSDLSSQARYRLIFQGTGTRCFEGAHYKRWILQILGTDPDIKSKPTRTIYYWFKGQLESGS